MCVCLLPSVGTVLCVCVCVCVCVLPSVGTVLCVCVSPSVGRDCLPCVSFYFNESIRSLEKFLVGSSCVLHQYKVLVVIEL